jgi:hypothetical protein
LKMPRSTADNFFGGYSLSSGLRLPRTRPILALVLVTISTAQRATSQAPATPETIQVGGARLQIDFEGPALDLPKPSVEAHLRQAAQAVNIYYGRFPVSSADIIVLTTPGQEGMLQGTTWGNVKGFAAVSRLKIGEHTTAQELDGDWIATHELVHMALPSLPDAQHWLEEGIATYVEPIARVQAGRLHADYIWKEMLEGMPFGEPKAGDRGLDRTHTWGRTYWGGALFCLWADVEIRKKTANQKGLQDALRGIVESSGTLNREWPVLRVLRAGDDATGTTVLQDLYTAWSENAVPVDLFDLWQQLGVRLETGKIVFDDAAPLANIRLAITSARPATR